MTDFEINKSLALAIGWDLECITWSYSTLWVGRRMFDYRDNAVIWPICERYDFFPIARRNSKTGKIISWEGYYKDALGFVRTIKADTAAKAAALAAIAAYGSGA